MTHDEILKGLYDETLVGNAPAVRDLTNLGLAEDLSPESMLFDGLIPSLEEVGPLVRERGIFGGEPLVVGGKLQLAARARMRQRPLEQGAITEAIAQRRLQIIDRADPPHGADQRVGLERLLAAGARAREQRCRMGSIGPRRVRT